MEILKENSRYQAIVDNLEKQGYTVEEKSAQVVETYTPADYEEVPKVIDDDTWRTAVLIVNAVKGDDVKEIRAFICINKEELLSIVDAWWCYPACLAGCAGGCYAFCYATANPALCWYCSGGCDTFCTVFCG